MNAAHTPRSAAPWWRLMPAGVLSIALVGCATTREVTAFDLDATRTALSAQMDETEELEGALAEERSAPAPAPVVAPAPAPPPEPEVAPDPGPVEVEEDVTYWEDDTMVEAAAPPAPAAVEAPALIGGMGGLPGGSGAERIAGSVDRVARALEQQNTLTILEARLADKQRLIDHMEARISGRLDPLGLGGGVSSGGPSEVETALAKRLQELAAAQEALQAQLAQKATEEAEQAAQAAVSDEEAEEQARWDALMARLQAVEQGKAPVADPAEAPLTDAAAPAAAPAAAAPAAAEPPGLREELEALKKQNAERAAEDERRRREAEEARAAQEESERQARLEAQLTALATRQDQMMTAMAADDRNERRLFRRIFQREGDRPRERKVEVQTDSEPEPALDSASLRAAIREAMRERDAEAARRPLEDAEDDEEESEETEAEAEERSAIEARVSELIGRLDALESTRQPTAADDAEVSALQAELADLRAREAALVSERKQYDQRDQRLQELLQPLVSAGLAVTVDGDRARVALPSDVLFGSGSANLSAAGTATVKDVGRVLLSAPGLRIQVEGHTDNVPIRGGRFESNWDLAFARARTVLQALEAAGVPTRRMSAASYGDTRPITENTTPAGRSANRRIDIALQLEED